VQRWIEKMHLKFFQPFLQFLKDNKVQYLIVTHFFPIHLVKTIKADSNSKLIVVVTDLGAHPLWVDSQVDLYCVPLDFTRQELIEQGVDESKIAVTGMPLRQGFLQPVEPQRVREELSFDDKPVILVLSSTHKSLLYLKSMVKYLTKDFNLVIIYGNNREAKKFLTQVNNKRVRSFQYYGKIWQLMALASFIITKPGGLTVFEGLYMNKPLIFTHFIFGQEKRNMEIIQTLGKGFYAPSFKQLKDILYYSVFSRDQDRVYNVKNKNIFTAIESKVDR
jgi:processive 1,2-diacylglycerol beta-glucosyltransferase